MTSAPRVNIPVPIPAGQGRAPVPAATAITPPPSGSPTWSVPSRSAMISMLHGTPGRMRVLGALAALAALILGATSVNSLLASKAAIDRAASNTAQVIRVQSLHVELLRADALATNAFLVGGLEPPTQRSAYDAALSSVASGITEAAAAQPADAVALAALSDQVQTYAGLVQQGRTNNRQGLPVGAQYLKQASAGLRADAIPIVTSIVKANEGRASAEFTRADSTAWLLVGGLALVGMVLVAIWLARRTRRYLNPSLTGAIVLSLVTLFAAVATISSIAATTAGVAVGDYRDAVALADVSTAANDARANESLTLIARGSGAANEKAWEADAKAIDIALPSLHQVDQSDWLAYKAAHAEIRKADEAGNWDQAVTLSTATSAGSAGVTFTAFDSAVTQARDAAGQRAVSTLTGVGGNTTLIAVLIAIAALVSAWLIIRGMTQRLREYA